ncbi:Aminodeoxychorismate synthase component 1 [Andreprevotia sp. IGB-42]|uniref:aminodeoxychorismate synthase component I n=1 Tax=Andreprevotia sp. IGB-42 TaxID=2497473 RepID=UPI001359F24C|nr:aminodeoxychorismate synthase component I [Andreprevotia sp. IGB-42]KAF0811724.1 Aminodeoxychorismate synthase component 1 [Andreprevotia sp. IGB-42]
MPIQTLAFIPDLAALAASTPAAFPGVLQSSGTQGWDVLFALPQARRIYRHDELAAFLHDLDTLPVHAGQDHALPFLGGWLVYAGYELLEAFEPTVPLRGDEQFPAAALIRCPAAVLVDRGAQQAFLVAETDDALQALAALVAAAPVWQASPLSVASVSEDDAAAFLAGAQRCKDYIVDGEVFQVNLSRGWRVQLASGSPYDLYAALRAANPAPFSALLNLGEQQIVSSSPERLVKVSGGVVETRPIAGTHPRGGTPAEDEALKQKLISTVKERAEHIMLVDLERNDLGRIAVPGSVEVDELMAVASYAFVHHIESNIRARLQPGTTVRQVLRALFPGGTITGCPKVRCMQIIRELEDAPRAAYTGSLGYVGVDGRMDFNILIRTFMQQQQQLYFRAGAGIVADSDPARELQETRHKARGLLRALGVAG